MLFLYYNVLLDAPSVIGDCFSALIQPCLPALLTFFDKTTVCFSVLFWKHMFHFSQYKRKRKDRPANNSLNSDPHRQMVYSGCASMKSFFHGKTEQ